MPLRKVSFKVVSLGQGNKESDSGGLQRAICLWGTSKDLPMILGLNGLPHLMKAEGRPGQSLPSLGRGRFYIPDCELGYF